MVGIELHPAVRSVLILCVAVIASSLRV